MVNVDHNFVKKNLLKAIFYMLSALIVNTFLASKRLFSSIILKLSTDCLYMISS